MSWISILIHLAFLLALLAIVLPLYPNADVLNARVCAFYVDACHLFGCSVNVPAFCAYGDGVARASADAGYAVATLSDAESSAFGPVFTYAHWSD